MHFIHTKTSLQMRIIEKEQRTAEQMIRIYCRYKEGNKELCPTCRQLLQYAHNRLKHCTFGEQKKTCRNCPIHCYKPEMKKRIQEVMRYAGPRMFFFHQAFHSSINRMDRAQFYKEVYSITKEIPYGNVFTYGKIAQLIGNPQYSRMVGQALSHAPKEEDLPCHRVVNSQGRLVPSWQKQKELLEKEGITFKRNGCVNMSKHLWDITGSLTSTIGISPTSATWQ